LNGEDAITIIDAKSQGKLLNTKENVGGALLPMESGDRDGTSDDNERDSALAETSGHFSLCFRPQKYFVKSAISNAFRNHKGYNLTE
jgi:hypothetical protein